MRSSPAASIPISSGRGCRSAGQLVQQRPALIDRMVFMSGGAVSDRTRGFISRDDIVLLAKPFTLDHLLAVLLRVPAA